MARTERQRSSVEWYHVMNRGSRRWPTFVDDRDRRSFLRVLGDVVERFGIEIHGFCLMGNHYHLLLHAPEMNLSEAMQYLGGVYTQRFNRAHGFDGPLFRGRFRSKNIEDEAYLIAVARYIERNPISLVDRLEDYPWSSLRYYAGTERPPSWVSTSTILNLYGRRSKLVEACRDGRATGISDKQILDDLEVSTLPPKMSAELIEELVFASCLEERTFGTTGRQGLRNEARQLMVYLGCEFAQLSAAETAVRYGFSGSSSARSALHRARQRVANDSDFAALVSKHAVAILNCSGVSEMQRGV